MSSDVSEKRTIEEILSIIENQLSVGKTSVKITPIEQLVGVNKTYRCNIETISGTSTSNESIIIKYNPKKPSPNKTQPINILQDLDDFSKRFNNEAAALTYLNSIQFPNKIHPTLIHQDIKNQLIVTKDMGKNPTLMDLMNNPQLEEPETYLKNYVNLFAELHKYTINNWQRFKEIQKQFSASSPLSDSTMDFRNNPSDFRALLEYIDSRYKLDKESIIKEFNQIEETVFNPDNLLYGFIHADSGIQNVNVDLESKQMVLFDYEFADTGYMLLDIAGLFLGVPQSGKGKRIPSKHYDMLIQEYSNSLSLTSEKLKENLVYALIHWTIGRIIGLWMFYLRPHLDGLDKVEIGFLNKTFTSNHECLNFLEKNKQFTHLRKFIEVIQLFMLETWENIELVDYFSSFIDLS
jgi:hypothetical protein